MPQPQSQKQAQALLGKYPFLDRVYRREVQSIRGDGIEVVLNVHVRSADPNLMFRQADNVEGNGHSMVDVQDPTIQGAQWEYYLPVGHGGTLGEIRHWRTNKDHYVRNLFSHDIRDWSGDRSWHESAEDPCAVIEALVWVTRETWRTRVADLGAPYDESWPMTSRPVRRINLDITLYKPPRQGWRQLYETADPLVNVRLYGSQLMPGAQSTDAFRSVVYDRLNRLAREFQRKVWETGLGVIVDASRKKGMSGQYGNVKLLTYIMAGRLLVQFERGDVLLTLHGSEDSNPRLHFGSIDGTVVQAEKLARDVIRFWQQADEETRRTVHRDNDQVSMF